MQAECGTGLSKRKIRVEILRSDRPKEEFALDRLTDAVLRRISDKERDAQREPESDEALTESVLMQPWCLPREVALAIRWLIPVWHWEKYSLVRG